MISVEEATEKVMARAGALPPALRPSSGCLGCVLAEDIEADMDVPPFDKALVDGYALRAADVAEGLRHLTIGESITAGRTPTRPLARREAAVIMTGAPLPQGADAVVMIEDTRREGPEVFLIGHDPIPPGMNRLARGREMRRGEVVARRGDRLRPARLGLLASVGRAEVLVIPRPRVSVVPTGDELVEPDRVPGPGQIRNSNATLLRALAASGEVDCETLPIAPDEPEALKEALRRGLMADVLLVAGGVSAGQLDLVPSALGALGANEVFHKVRIRPGKPLWFGIGPERGSRPGALVFGLPGNPVSVMVDFLLFVRPALDALWARTPERPYVEEARLASPFAHRGPRATYHPARLVEDGPRPGPALEPLEWAGSADLRPLAGADGFAIFPPGDRDHDAGATVGFLRCP